MKKRFAVCAITKHGVEIVRRLQDKMPDADVHYPVKFARGDEDERGIQLYEGNVRPKLAEWFPDYDGLVLVISLGAVVRMIAPLLKDKKVDPAIVVIDDRAEHVISVLSGHLGGANALTNRVAGYLEAKAVITTASDVNRTIPVDIFGERFGWKWESADNLTPVSAAVVNEEPIAVVQEAGERDWWEHERTMPEHIRTFTSVQEALRHEWNAALVITHRLLHEEEQIILRNGVCYRPKVLALGIGCNKGTSAAEIDSVIHDTLAELNFSPQSVKALCSIDLKKDEAGIVEVSNKYGWPFYTYPKEVLNEVKVEQPSEVVYKYVGTYSVSESAVRVYSQAEKLALVKKKSGNVTLSVAVIPHHILGSERIWQEDL